MVLLCAEVAQVSLQGARQMGQEGGRLCSCLGEVLCRGLETGVGDLHLEKWGEWSQGGVSPSPKWGLPTKQERENLSPSSTLGHLD